MSSDFLGNVFILYFTVLSVIIILCLIRAIKGPRFTDRIGAINVIGTISTAAICLISVYIKEEFLTDVSLVYALLNFLAVVILSRVVAFEQSEKKNSKTKEDKK